MAQYYKKERLDKLGERTLEGMTDSPKEIVIEAGEWMAFDPEALGMAEVIAGNEPPPQLTLTSFRFSFEGEPLPSAFMLNTGLPGSLGISFPREGIMVEVPSESGYYLILPNRLGIVLTETAEKLQKHPKIALQEFALFEVDELMVEPEVRALLCKDDETDVCVTAGLHGGEIAWHVDIPDSFSEEEKEELRKALNAWAGAGSINMIPKF